MSQFAKYFNTKLDLMHQEPLTKKENLAFYLKTNSAPALKFTKMMSDKGSLHQPTVREDVIKKWKNGISLIKKLQLSKLFKKKRTEEQRRFTESRCKVPDQLLADSIASRQY